MQDKKFLIIDDYILVKNLGQGGNAIVKLGLNMTIQVVNIGYNKLTGNYNAIKFCKPSDLITENKSNYKAIKNEAEVLSRLNHENIINLIEVQEQSGTIYTVLELAEEGELYEYLSQTGGLSEQITRTLFNQLIEGLSYCHSQQITHRDIKLENILLDKNFVLKLTDFGFAAPTTGKNESGFNNSCLGTPNYLAPEIEQKLPYKGELADIFACGVVLFTLYTGSFPFEEATFGGFQINEIKLLLDSYYRLIIKDQQTKFWQVHSRLKETGFFSNEFQDLINRMLAYNPNDRITIEEIKTHPWFTGKTLPQFKIMEEFKFRKQQLQCNQ